MGENRSRKKTSFQLFNIKSSPAVNEPPNELQVYSQKANSLIHSLTSETARPLTSDTTRPLTSQTVELSPVTSRPASLLRRNAEIEASNGQSSGYGC